MESEAVRDNNHSLVEAIKKKYEEDHTGDEHSFIQIYVPKKGPCPQAQGSQDYQVPPRLALDNCGVTEAGPGEQIESLCSQVKELDMSKNRVTDWLQVFQIIQHIPLLHFLNLSFNPLENESFPIDLNTTFEGITVLILNGAGISWVTVERVLNCFPRLAELHLSLNNYETVELPAGTCHNSLTKLFINGCKLSQWSDITKLGRCFPSLEFLNMINSDIQHLEEDCIVDAFPVLKNLNISGNPLESWEEIDKLRQFPALENLRIADLPFLEELVETERRQHLVSRLPSVKCLNGSRIGGVEREDAERAFIRAFMSKDVKPPRYYELEAVYGKLDPLVHVDLTPQNIIQLVVKFEEKVELMDIDKRQTVLEFKKLLRNFTGLPAQKFRLMHVENFEGKYRDSNEMKFPNKTLVSMNMNEGDEIVIYKKD